MLMNKEQTTHVLTESRRCLLVVSQALNMSRGLVQLARSIKSRLSLTLDDVCSKSALIVNHTIIEYNYAWFRAIALLHEHKPLMENWPHPDCNNSHVIYSVYSSFVVQGLISLAVCERILHLYIHENDIKMMIWGHDIATMHLAIIHDMWKFAT